METLKLEHIAPYLPYELNAMKYDSYGNSSEVTLDIWCLNKYPLEYNYIKPILLPLSDLTKEIYHEGEKFVPLLELYKLRTQITTDKIDSYYIEFDTAVLKLKEINAFNKTIKTYFEVDIDPNMVSFSIVTERYENGHITGENINMCGNELAMYQFLFNHHFDVFGLIDKGLAIDINTLNK